MQLAEHLVVDLAVSRLRAIPMNSHLYHSPLLQYSNRPETEASRQRPTDPIHHSPFTSYQPTPYRKACMADIMLAQEIESLKQGAC